jgi:voltage-gated potassium channel
MVLWPLGKIRHSLAKVLDTVRGSQRNLILFFLLIVAVQFLILYFLDGKPFVDALYGTVATITTVGFGDVSPTSPAARLLYIPAMIAGVLMLPTVAVVVYEIHQQKVRGMRDSKQTGHVVVIGDSAEVIKAVVEEMENDREICLITDIYSINPYPARVHFVKGSPEDKAVLRQAGVDMASHVIVAERSDGTTVLVTALVREINPSVNIICTVVSEERSNTLKTVGANQIINTDTVTGRLLASAVQEPAVADLISDVTSTLQGHDIIEVKAADMAGKTVRELTALVQEEKNAILLAINRNGINMVRPAPDIVVEKEDRLVLLK